MIRTEQPVFVGIRVSSFLVIFYAFLLLNDTDNIRLFPIVKIILSYFLLNGKNNIFLFYNGSMLATHFHVWKMQAADDNFKRAVKALRMELEKLSWI